MTHPFSGCERCGYVGRKFGYRDGVLAERDCPRCGGALKEVDLVQARALARDRQRERGFRARVQSQLADRDRAYDARTEPSPVDSSDASPADSGRPRE